MEGNNRMWIIGHSAVAYLSSKLIYKVKKQEISEKTLFFIFYFANSLDVFHFGSFRLLTHNFIGAYLLAFIGLFLFCNIQLISYQDAPVLLFAIFSHIITDIFFSGFYIFFPFSLASYTIFGWNSIEHLVFGTFITAIFLIVFISTGDFTRCRELLKEKISVIKKHSIRSSIFMNNFLFIILFISYCSFVFAQLSLFLVLFLDRLLEGIIYIQSFFIVFTLFFLCFSVLLLDGLLN